MKYKRYLSGYWVGNYEYIKTAGLLNFELLFDESLKNCYIQMGNSNDLIFSDLVPVDIKIPYLTSGFCNSCDKEVNIIIVFNNDDLPFNNTLKGKLSLLNGTLKLYYNDELSGFFEKDHTIAY
jgi:hypothetical protein